MERIADWIVIIVIGKKKAIAVDVLQVAENRVMASVKWQNAVFREEGSFAEIAGNILVDN